MRIKELSEQSGISRRNIHFYLQEGLLAPKADAENGYYLFSEEDLSRLLLIRRLRAEGLSIPAIRSLLRTPASAEYHLRMQLARIESEQVRLARSEASLRTALAALPVHPDEARLKRIVLALPDPVPDAEPRYDGALVNHFLFRLFITEEEMSEYGAFLWDKLNRMTARREDNADYAALYDYLACRDHTHIDGLYAERSEHYGRIAALEDEEVERYAERILARLDRFCSSPELIRRWRRDMEECFLPMMRIYLGPIGRIGEELCPLFRAYKLRSSRACEIAYRRLIEEEHEDLLSRLEAALGEDAGYLHRHHASLEAISMLFPPQI